MLTRILSYILSAGIAFGAPVTVPAGTDLSIRLKTKVTSNASKPKDPVQAVLIAPVVIGGEVAIAAGAELKGEVVEAKPTSGNERAILHLDFTQISETGGKAVKIKGKIVDVDNAREAVDENGKITGISGSESISGRLDQGIEKLSARNSSLGGLLEVAKAAVVKQTNAEIQYEAGVEMTLRTSEPLTWNETIAGPTIEPIRDEDALARLVNAQPFQTFAEKPLKPSDITNLMFVGSEEKLRDIFKAAGWDTAQALSGQSKLETARAIIEVRGYKEAPMSVLLLEKEAPDMVFQKQNNTFAARHHLRIWKRPGTWEGQPIWVSSSTHDTGIAFSEENRTFIHKIDSQIDKERGKVVADLLFTGQVKSLALVARPEVPTLSKNATGDEIQTDGRMAVVILK
jgi:hypothetical protein